MANNVITNPGVGGAEIATENDGTAHHQKVLPEFGDPGTQQRVTPRIGLPIAPADGPAVDAFGRFRSSGPTTLFDNKQLWDSQPLFWDDQQTAGAGTSSAHSTATASTTLSTSLNTAGTRVRQTFQRFNYQPGKSQLVVMTGTLGAGVAGITRRIGLFDGNDGLFFNQIGVALGVTIRSSTSGSPVDTTVTQPAWNLDKMDGTGPSGVTLNPANSQVFLVDFQWLGSGRVRFGVYVGGHIVYVHEFLRANLAVNPYMSTPNLPLRYEISSGAASPVSSLIHTCSTVIAEGGAERGGRVIPLSSGVTPIIASAVGTIYAIKGVRLRTTHLDAVTLADSIEVLISAGVNSLGQWFLIHNPSVAGTFTYTDVAGSAFQGATGVAANTVTGGTIVDSGFALPARQGASTSKQISGELILGSSIAEVRDTMVLCFMPITTNVSVHGIVGMRQLS